MGGKGRSEEQERNSRGGRVQKNVKLEAPLLHVKKLTFSQLQVVVFVLAFSYLSSLEGALHGRYADPYPGDATEGGWAHSRQLQRGHLSFGSSSYPGVRSSQAHKKLGGRANNLLRMKKNGGSRRGGRGGNGRSQKRGTRLE